MNGDTLTVRSTNLERITLSSDEVAHLETFAAEPADPLELLQRTIDRSVRITADDGVEVTNEFDEARRPAPASFLPACLPAFLLRLAPGRSCRSFWVCRSSGPLPLPAGPRAAAPRGRGVRWPQSSCLFAPGRDLFFPFFYF